MEVEEEASDNGRKWCTFSHYYLLLRKVKAPLLKIREGALYRWLQEKKPDGRIKCPICGRMWSWPMSTTNLSFEKTKLVGKLIAEGLQRIVNLS
jgi:hypothetical protein